MSVAMESVAVAHGKLILENPLALLKDQVLGEVILPETDQYDAARAVGFFTVDRRPAVIVRPVTAEDVSTAVLFAQEHDLEIAVRSGGHSLAAHSVVQGAMVIDLSAMKKVKVDPLTQIARVQGGATSGDIVAAAQPLGLALSTGDTRSVGIGGLTTGGGIGLLARKHGLTIDSLVSAEVVLADGRIVRASETEHPDLFWAVRGGGGNFGIVTEFTFRLAQVGMVLGGLLVLPASPKLMREVLDYAYAAPDGLTVIADVMHAPPAPFIPEERIGERVAVLMVTWTGTLEEGLDAVAPLRALAEPVADTIAPIPYENMYLYTDQYSGQHGAAVRMMFADDVTDAMIDDVFEAMGTASSPATMMQFRAMGGAVSRVAEGATAFAHRSQKYFVSIINVWIDPADDPQVHRAWTDALFAKLQPCGRGAYVNFLEAEGETRVQDAYPAETYARLAAVKAIYDPQNVFHFNQNIKPAV
ncbi:MAG: FAD-binding oxidoreductase [Thermomicrobiales bacterium]|nr:FAD-binding oxidoreductase [Thermomicrobiales bacterium]